MTGILQLSLIMTIALLGVICFPPVYKYISKDKVTSKSDIDRRQVASSIGVPFRPYDKELFESVILKKRAETEKAKSNILDNPFLLAMIIAAPLALIVLITSCAVYCVQRSKLKMTLEEETRRTAEEKARIKAMKGKKEGKGAKGNSTVQNTTPSVVKTSDEKSSGPKHGVIQTGSQTAEMSALNLEETTKEPIVLCRKPKLKSQVSEADSLILKLPLEGTIGVEPQKEEALEKKPETPDQVKPMGTKEQASRTDIPTGVRLVTAIDEEKHISFQLMEHEQLEPVVPVYREDTISVIITRDQKRPSDSKHEDDVTLEAPLMLVVEHKMDISSVADLSPEKSGPSVSSGLSSPDELELKPPNNMQHPLEEKMGAEEVPEKTDAKLIDSDVSAVPETLDVAKPPSKMQHPLQERTGTEEAKPEEVPENSDAQLADSDLVVVPETIDVAKSSGNMQHPLRVKMGTEEAQPEEVPENSDAQLADSDVVAVPETIDVAKLSGNMQHPLQEKMGTEEAQPEEVAENSDAQLTDSEVVAVAEKIDIAKPPRNMQHLLQEKTGTKEYKPEEVPEKRNAKSIDSQVVAVVPEKLEMADPRTIEKEPKDVQKTKAEVGPQQIKSAEPKKEDEKEEAKVLTSTSGLSVFSSHSSASSEEDTRRPASVPRQEPNKLLANTEEPSGPKSAQASIMVSRSLGETSFNVPPSGTIVIRDEQSSRKDTEDMGFTVVHKKGYIEIRPSNPLSVTIRDKHKSYPSPAEITPIRRRSSI